MEFSEIPSRLDITVPEDSVGYVTRSADKSVDNLLSAQQMTNNELVAEETKHWDEEVKAIQLSSMGSIDEASIDVGKFTHHNS